MARMSIDDMVGRDPRITMLAQTLGWSRREVVGCLVADVWPIVYDQRTELISERVLDAAAGHAGFAAALIECELATRDRSGKVVIRGARERIKYLDHKTEAGRQGGLKSAESRSKNSSKRQARGKQTSSSGEADVKHGGSTGQAAGNPPVPDTVPVPSLSPDSPPAARESKPTGRRAILAGDHAGFDAETAEHRGALAEWVWSEINRRRLALAQEFGLPAPVPLAPITPATHPPAFRDLRARVTEEGKTAPAVCLHVLEAATVHARKERSIEWMAEKLCTEGGWRWARGQVPTWRSSAPAAPLAADDSRRYGFIDGERVLL